MEQFRGTTILSVRRNGKVVIGGDGQVSMGNTCVPLSGANLTWLTGPRARPRGLVLWVRTLILLWCYKFMHFVGDFEKALHCSDPVSLSHADGRPPRNAVALFKYCALCCALSNMRVLNVLYSHSKCIQVVSWCLFTACALLNALYKFVWISEESHNVHGWCAPRIVCTEAKYTYKVALETFFFSWWAPVNRSFVKLLKEASVGLLPSSGGFTLKERVNITMWQRVGHKNILSVGG